MKIKKWISGIALFLIFFMPGISFSERGICIQQKRVALIIGNSAYKKSLLKNPVNDAMDIRSIIGQMGFDIIYKENAGLIDMKKAIDDFGRRLRHGGVGLFYFAGHGMQVRGQNYLIPVDATIETESDVEYESVSADRILGKMYDARNAVNIVILDACRDNPFARGFRSSKSGLAKLDAPAGTIIAYATAPGSVAADGVGRNGIYTKYLLENIRLKGITVEEVFKRVRIQVLNETQRNQVPWESSSLTGYFYFAGGAEGSSKASSAPKLKSFDVSKEAQKDTELELLETKLEQERMLLDREKQLAAIRRERARISEGSIQGQLETNIGVSQSNLDRLVGRYSFKGPTSMRKFNLVVSKAGSKLKAKSTDNTFGKFIVKDFEITDESMDFELQKRASGYKDVFEVHAELSINYNKIPVTLELIDSNNPMSRIGWTVSGILVRY